MEMTTTSRAIGKALGDILGYTAAFDEALKSIGEISPQEFAERYASNAKYLPQINWDPTTAKFWDEFNLSPEENNKNKDRKMWREADFRLQASEREVFKKNGFVVSERLGARSFGELFYRLYSNNLPVFVSTDALLHAWHRSYNAILAELEESYLFRSLDEIFAGMAKKIPEAWNEYGKGVLGESIIDADYFLAVARSLLGGEKLPDEQMSYSFEVPSGLSPENPRHWICPDIRPEWKLSHDHDWSNLLCLQSVNSNRQFWFSSGETFAMRHFTGEMTVEQVQEICQRKLRNSISPNFVEDLLKRLANLEILKLHNKAVKTCLNQDERTLATLRAIAEQKIEKIRLFGRDREIDFSQFKLRGHYGNSELLKRYFRTMAWCDTSDITGGTPSASSAQEIGAAIVLYDLLKRSDKFSEWQQFNQLLQTFVGRTNSISTQVDKIYQKTNINPPDVADLSTLEQLQADILLQNVYSHYHKAPLTASKALQPRSFTFLGQKFVLESWAMSKVVYDEIVWDGQKVPRCIPASLDVAFAVLGNNQVVPKIVARMTNTKAAQFRDKLNYQHNLAAVRNVIDAQNEAAWEENISMHWLATLRSLSAPITKSAAIPEKKDSQKGNNQVLSFLFSEVDLKEVTPSLLKTLNTPINLNAPINLSIPINLNAPINISLPDTGISFGQEKPSPKYPSAMGTREWAMKTLNTQLASWTCLRHAPSIDAKQSYTYDISFYCPDGFVEPQPAFWERFEKMAIAAANMIEETTFPDTSVDKIEQGGSQHSVRLQDIKKRQTDFFKNFAQTVAMLKEISVKELAQEELNEPQTQFLRKIVEIVPRGAGKPQYSGWYFNLFYKEPEDAYQRDAIVAEVHSASPNPELGNPGGVLYQGVGNVDLLMMAVDNGKEKTVYAGPVLSHYEFEMPSGERKSDLSWQEDIEKGKAPPRPDLIKSYLVSGLDPP